MKRRATNKNLQHAKKSKTDEFFTQMVDIERELCHYQYSFRGKVVYCNCDDPRLSNFVRYFVDNFKQLGLKQLIASSYNDAINDFFHPAEDARGSYWIYQGETDAYGQSISVNPLPLSGNGDFRSSECLNLLDKADVVVTNPPFSLFRDFVGLLMRHNKEFLIIGNINAITYKEIFTLIQENKVWLGYNLGRGISGFIVPENYELYGTEVRIDDDGNRIVATNNCLWLTNLENSLRHENIALSKSYMGNESYYQRFDNCDGINVDKTQDIPKDYPGLMGVPITFLHKYNPDQFEIVRFRKGNDGKDLRINGKCPYFRILIRKKLASV